MLKDVLKELAIVAAILTAIFLFVFKGDLFLVRMVDTQPKEDCVEVQAWKIREYYIKKDDCAAPALFKRPKLYLYKNDEQISDRGFINSTDDCKLDFMIQKGHHIKIDVCKRIVQELRSNKQMLIADKVDSAFIYSKKEDTIKELHQKQITQFAKEWNVASPNYYVEDLASKLYEFKVTFFIDGHKREYKAVWGDVSEIGDWEYEFSTASVFREIWQEL
jgi:hypothetical protein